MLTIPSTDFCPNAPTNAYLSFLSYLVAQYELPGRILSWSPTRFVTPFLS